MTSDLNKGIAANGIEYNHLNMPTKITVSNAGSNNGVVEYSYAADGTKVQKRTTQGGNVTTTDYIGDYVYENGNLKQITQPEGYIEPDGSSWQYVYRYIDVWGNTRITYADDNGDGSVNSSEIRREQNYYPFGLEHKGYNSGSYGVENNLKTYQGQEFTNDLGLNVHEWRYRMSDPSIGRFWQIDPLADTYVYNSTYAFAENKLGMGIELEGLEQAPSWGMEYKNAKTADDMNRINQAKQMEAAGTVIGVAAWVVPAIVSAVGWRATGTFVANEVKDEVVSQATGGLSDFVDLSKMATKGIKAGIKKIKDHLSNPDLKLDPDVANDVMLDDLEKIAKGEMEPTDVHNDYFNHEIRESEHVANGLSYPEAHSQTLKDQDIDPLTSESRLYTKEAKEKGDAAYKKQVEEELKN